MDLWRTTEVKRRPQQSQNWGWGCTSEGTELEDQALVNAVKEEEKFGVCGKEAAIR